MDPGALVPDVDHLKDIFIQTGRGQRFLKKRFVRFGGTCRDHHPVQILLTDYGSQIIQSILGTAEQTLVRKSDIIQILSIFNHRWNINDSGDIGSAAADKHADSGTLTNDILLHWSFFFLGQRPASIIQERAGTSGRGARFNDRRGDVLWCFNSPTCENTRF